MPTDSSDRSHYLSNYADQPARRAEPCPVRIYDTHTGEFLATLDDNAAQAIRAAVHGPVRLTYNGPTELVQVES
jgi:hypothetical protein